MSGSTTLRMLRLWEGFPAARQAGGCHLGAAYACAAVRAGGGGTGGFFLGAYRSIVERFPHLEPDQVAHLRSGAFTGWEIADLPARLCAMNMLLHGIESPKSDSPIVIDDALRDSPASPSTWC